MAANLEEQQCLRECTEYMQRSKIVPVMKDCFVQLCVDQPENPVSFLREYFQKLERVSLLLSNIALSLSLSVIFRYMLHMTALVVQYFSRRGSSYMLVREGRVIVVLGNEREADACTLYYISTYTYASCWR